MMIETNKRRLQKCVSLLAAAALVLSPATGITAFAGVLGDTLHTKSIEIQEEIFLANGVYWNSSAADKVTENYIVYEPGESDVIPIIAYGNDIYGAASFSKASETAKSEYGGGSILAGINGDYFTMANGVPQGIEIKDGVLYTSETPTYPSIGFYEDGTAIIGDPGLNIKMSSSVLSSSVASLHMNKVMTTACGVVLYTDEFADDDTNKSTIPTYNILISVEDGEPKINGTLTGTVASAADSSGAMKIPAGMVLVSMASATTYTYTLNQLKTLKAGDSVTFDFTANEAWEEVKYGIGAGEKIVTNGSSVAPMTTTLQTSLNPRTAVGIKADGTLIFYTLDGRQSGYSRGATLAELAKRMIELGCVEAVNMDGGGSTAVHTIYPGDSVLSTINSPSEGTLRSCANYIMLLNTGSGDGKTVHLHPYPYDVMMLAGASQSFTIKATDKSYYPSTAPDADDINYDADAELGTFAESGAFTAGKTAGSGTISFTSGKASGTATVSVITKPESINLVNESDATAVTALAVSGGTTVNLTAKSVYHRYALVSSDPCYTWNVSGNIGTVDQNGLFTAAKIASGSGTITASAGGTTATVNVTVTSTGQMLEGFEGSTSLLSLTSGAGITSSINHDLSKVRFGKKSAKIVYDFTTAETDRLTVLTSMSFTTSPTNLSLWVYGDGSGNTLKCNVGVGALPQEVTVGVVDFTGWKQLLVDLPTGVTSVQSIQIEQTGQESGTLYLDQIMRTNGYYVDTEAPIVTITVSGQAVNAQLNDLTDIALSTANIALTYDGTPLTVSYDGTTKKLTATLPAADGNGHKVTLIVSDRSGNATRATVAVAAAATAAQPFSDMNGHWAKESTAYLYSQSIVKGTGSGASLLFQPDKSITRAEFVVMISRWLGVDEAAYASTVLPFADAGSIPSWASGAAKAMYSMGIVQGTGSGGKLYFNASSTISREEVMTILGRTQQRGYSEADLSSFSDEATIAAWALPYVKTFVGQGIITGFDGGIWPKKAVTRAQIATILYKLN